MKRKKEINDLDRALIHGSIQGRFIIENASNPDLHPILLNVSEKLKDPSTLRACVRGILKCEGFGNIGESKGLKIIGIGSSTLNILNLLKDSAIPNEDILFLDNDGEILNKSSFNNIKLPWPKMFFITKGDKGEYVPLSWGEIHHGGPSLGRLMALGITDNIAKNFESVDRTIVVVNLGGSVGSGASPIITAILKEMGIKVIAIIQLPFYFEYIKRLIYACESLKIIQQLAYKTLTVKGEEVLREHNMKNTVLDIFKILDIHISNLVKKLDLLQISC